MLVSDPVEHYVESFGSRESPVRQRLRVETARLPQAGMQIGADQGALMAMLVRLTGARRALEVGTFTGYSALAVAEALPPEGHLVTCDISEEWTAIARRYWREAELDGKIELRLGDARSTLAALRREAGDGSFDFAFIDADKSGYDHYYEACLQLVRPGGMILIDNVLWSGKVADPDVQDQDTVAIRTLNAKIATDPRVEACLLTVGDGVMLTRKK
jgi:predicted O-methyltransferase YrrM